MSKSIAILRWDLPLFNTLITFNLSLTVSGAFTILTIKHIVTRIYVFFSFSHLSWVRELLASGSSKRVVL